MVICTPTEASLQTAFSSKRVLMDYFNSLPLEIILEMLIRLPAESIPSCKLVCKNLGKDCFSPSFQKMHLHHLNQLDMLSFLALTGKPKNFSYFEYNEKHDELTTPIDDRILNVNLTTPFWSYSFVGSCNGLICLADGLSVCIFNPITTESLLLPKYKIDGYDRSGYWKTGFGYVSMTHEYKVVGMCKLITGLLEVHMYTLGSGNGWIDLGKFNSRFSPYDWHIPCIFANGALYWLDRGLEMIIAFNLAEEKFCESILPPPLPPGNNRSKNRIGVLEGFLYFAVRIVVPKGSRWFDVYLLKEKSDNHEMENQQKGHQSLVWSKGFSIDKEKLLAVTKSGSVLTWTENSLYIYDPKLSTSKRLVRFKDLPVQVFIHKNTLVSLKEIGEADRKP